MNDKITQEILHGDLNKAKDLIQQFEDSITTEKSEYTRSRNKSMLNNYKDMYASKLEIKKAHIQELGVELNAIQEKHKTKNCLFLENKTGLVDTTKHMHSDIRIYNCHDCKMTNLEVAHSFVIDSCSNMHLKCKAGQIRIKDSIKIVLEIENVTGVGLENSSEILIYDNLCGETALSVFDFTSPFLQKNYKIVKCKHLE